LLGFLEMARTEAFEMLNKGSGDYGYSTGNVIVKVILLNR